MRELSPPPSQPNMLLQLTGQCSHNALPWKRRFWPPEWFWAKIMIHACSVLSSFIFIVHSYGSLRISKFSSICIYCSYHDLHLSPSCLVINNLHQSIYLFSCTRCTKVRQYRLQKGLRGWYPSKEPPFKRSWPHGPHEKFKPFVEKSGSIDPSKKFKFHLDVKTGVLPKYLQNLLLFGMIHEKLCRLCWWPLSHFTAPTQYGHCQINILEGHENMAKLSVPYSI